MHKLQWTPVKVYGPFAREVKEFLRVNEAGSAGVEGSTTLMPGSSGHAHSSLALINNFLSVQHNPASLS